MALRLLDDSVPSRPALPQERRLRRSRRDSRDSDEFFSSHFEIWSMTNRSGFIIKRAYPGKKGLYVEFFTTEDAEGFYAKGVATGSRVEKQDDLTIIMKFSEASNAQ